jgi:diguanylate cyclase (GGDEF)-like protein
MSLVLPLLLAATGAGPDLLRDVAARLLAASPGALFSAAAAAGLAGLGLAARDAGVRSRRSERQARAVTALQAVERRQHRPADDALDGLLHLEPVRDAGGTLADFRVVEANAGAAALLGRDASALVGARVRPFLGAREHALFEALAAADAAGAPYRGEHRLHPRRAATRWVLVRAVRSGTGVAVALTDVSDRHRVRRLLRRATFVDPLTGLANRQGFEQAVAAHRALARARGRDALLLSVNGDDFARINEHFDRDTGDRALVEIAHALRSALRDGDVVARLAGDAFAVLALDAAAPGAEAIRRRITAQLDALNRTARLPTSLGVTVGHTLLTAADARPFVDLLRDADLDLLHRKAARRVARAAMAAIAPPPVPPRPRGSRPTAPVVPVR